MEEFVTFDEVYETEDLYNLEFVTDGTRIYVCWISIINEKFHVRFSVIKGGLWSKPQTIDLLFS